MVSHTIKVPVDTLEEDGKKLVELSSGCKDLFDRIGNALEALRSGGQWVGDDIDALIAANTANQKKFQESMEDIEKLATHMKDFAQEMSKKDEKLKKKISAI